MKISEAITRLTQLQIKHGDVELFFDCPNCVTSFTPNVVVAIATHFKSVHHNSEKK